MEEFLKNKRVWITGAGRGIGLAIAEKLAETKATLILSARLKDSFANLPSELKSKKNIFLFPFDISSRSETESACTKISRTVGDIDILINNAGITSFTKFLDTSTDVFENIINTNLRGPYLCTKSVLPGMLKRNSGIIINIISVVALKTFTKSTAYAASKAGLLAMSRSLREEVRKYGIKIIDIFPGATETEIWSDDSRNKFRERMIKPIDVADIIYDAIRLSMNKNAMVEEIVFRPQEGDL